MAAIAGRRSVSPAGIRCHFILLDNDGRTYSTGELLNTPQVNS